jgi:pimeloyl-ACP methyl ester carboxylesterase
MKTGKLEINGVNIAYARLGKGTPLVLIHGYPLDKSIWEKVAGILEDDFDMIIPDLRGFGDSQLVDAGREILAYASDVAGLMKRLGVPKANVVGHSMGGYAALALLRAHPEMLLGLGLVSSQTLSDAPDRRQARYASAQEVLAKGVEPVAEAMAPKLSSDKGIQADMRVLISRQRPGGLASALEAMAERPDSTHVVSSCKVPVLAVHGQADALIPVERGRDVKTALPAAQYVELPRAGHMPMMEDPGAVAQALRFFLQPAH